MTARTTVGSIAMKGGGFYSRMTVGAAHMINSHTELFLSLLEQTRVVASRPYVIADYGAADGGTSLDLMTRIIRSQRARAPGQPVTIYYTDLPGADYGFMFRVLSGLEPGFSTYLGDPSVYAYATGISFHRPIFPDGMIDLGFSANAMHWLSEMPPKIEEHIHSVGASGLALNRLREIGRRDWEVVLANRAREMRPGAKILMLNFMLGADGRHLGKNDSRGIFDTLNVLWQNMADEGIISRQEYLDTNFAQYYKTIEEFREPFDSEDGAARTAGLELLLCDSETFKCTYRARYEENKDAVAFGNSFVANVRSWTERVFVNGLAPERSCEAKAEIVEMLYERYVQAVEEQPRDHNMDYIVCRMVASKR